MIDLGASTNVNPSSIMNELDLQFNNSYGKCFSLDSREVTIIGIIAYDELTLATFQEKTYNMNIIVLMF